LYPLKFDFSLPTCIYSAYCEKPLDSYLKSKDSFLNSNKNEGLYDLSKVLGRSVDKYIVGRIKSNFKGLKMRVTKKQKEICERIISEVVFNGSYRVKNATEHNLVLKIMREEPTALRVSKKKNYGRIDTVVVGGQS